MAESPIRISVELEGIEPNDRIQLALDELAAAAAELIEASAEVGGYAHGALAGVGDLAVRSGVWTDMRPTGKSWSFGVEREATVIVTEVNP